MNSNITLIRMMKQLRVAFMMFALFVIGSTLQAQTYVNGNLSTGATSQSGVAAPTGTTWSEVQNDAGVTTVSNSTSGVGSSISGNLSVADDFTIPVGPSWDITKFTFYAYQTGAPATPSPFNELRFQIHNSNPSAGATTIVFGDLTTNRLSTSVDALMYRCFNTTTPAPGTAPGTTRKIWALEANVTVNLAPGTYWIEWQTGVTTGNHFSPPSTVVGVRTVAGYNAQQRDIVANTWAPLEDAGNPATPPSVALDMPFIINYTAAGCFGTPTPGNTLSTATTSCPGVPFTLSVANTTAGTGVTYQWQSASAIGGPYTNIAGATSADLTTTQTASTFYQLVVTCSGAPGTSTPLQVVSIAPPTVTTPANATLCSGNNTSFTVTGTGTPVTYQWQVSTDGGATFTDVSNTGIYTGATTNTLTLTNVPSTENNNQYQVIVSIPGCSSATSGVATLTVNGSATFTVQPANVTACDAGDATFTTTTAGAAVTYQWQVSTDGGTTFNPIAGATSATLVVPAVTSGMSGYLYNVIISNACTASLTSTNASLTVINAAAITTQPVNATACEGASATFVVNASGTTFQWQVSTDGGANFSDIVGETSVNLIINPVTAAMNNNQYRLVVFSCGPTGLNSTPAILTVNSGVSITVQPANVTACVGNNATVFVTVTGTAPITYQWEASADGGTTYNPIPGATTNTLTIPNVTLAMNGGLAHVILSNGCTTSLISTAALLTVTATAVITADPVSTSTCEGANASFTVAATGSGLSYQWQESTNGGASFIDMPGQTGTTLTLNAVTASMNNNQYQAQVFSSCAATGTPSAIATLTVNASPVVVISASPYTSITTDLTTVITATSTPASTTFSWFLDGNLLPAVTGNSITVAHTDLGVYTASVTDANGCSGSSNAVTIADSAITRSFIYPNPNNGVFNVVFYDAEGGISNARYISAFDSKGARVFNTKYVVTSLTEKMVIDLSSLTNGVYMVEVTDAAGVRLRSERVVINK